MMGPFGGLFEAADPRTVLGPDETVERVVATFDQNIDYLRHKCPNPYIKHLCQTAARAIGNKLVQMGIAPLHIPSMGFAAIAISPATPLTGCIIMPVHWAKRCRTDPHWGRGGICFVASQVVDFVFDHIGEESHERAAAYEAEYYKTVAKRGEHIDLDVMQTEVMADYPRGLCSLPPGIYYPVLPLIAGDFIPLPSQAPRDLE